jgi:4-hydroxy-tetrahydrodipicolinate synthase
MKKTRELIGVIPVLTTPIHQDGSIDRESLIGLVNFLVTLDIGGLWVLGTGSEDMNLPFDKRLEIARIACEANAGRKPLILGSGFFALEDILSIMEKTMEFQADAYHVMPYHPLLSIDRLLWFYDHIATCSPKPLWMYTSANWAPPVTPELIARLKPHGNITGIKFSTRDALDMYKVLNLAAEVFQVITAVATQFLACLYMGSKAHTSSLGSVIPEALIKIYTYFVAGRHVEAKAAQENLNRFLGKIPKGLHKDNFLEAAQEKYLLSLRGLTKVYTTSYYRDVNKEEKESIRRAMEEHNIIPGL